MPWKEAAQSETSETDLEQMCHASVFIFARRINIPFWQIDIQHHGGTWMDIQRVHFLRVVLVADGKGKATITMEFAYDNGFNREPHFFGVPSNEVGQAPRLYLEWGGKCPQGHTRGTIARSLA
jgi:hypothetical protein